MEINHDNQSPERKINNNTLFPVRAVILKYIYYFSPSLQNISNISNLHEGLSAFDFPALPVSVVEIRLTEV